MRPTRLASGPRPTRLTSDPARVRPGSRPALSLTFFTLANAIALANVKSVSESVKTVSKREKR